MAPEEVAEDLDRDDVLKLNKIQARYSKSQIEEFIEEHMDGEIMDAAKLKIADGEAFEKLILAYDLSTRRNSKYMVLDGEPDMIEHGGYRYPDLKFVRRR